MTPAEFRAEHNLSADQFKRIKRKAEKANPGTAITEQVGGVWQITDQDLLTPHLPLSASPSTPSEPPTGSPGAIARYSPAPLVEAELVPEVAELEIVLPDHSAAIDRAHLEITHTAQIASGNRNLRRALRRKAIVEQATADAIEDFSLGDKAYEAAMAKLEQQQLNQLGIGQNAPTPTPTETAPAPAKK